MPEYRQVKRPASLVGSPLTKDEIAIVKAGGNEAAIGTDLTGNGQATQLDVWYRDSRTLLASKLDGKTVGTWWLKGYVSPEDCRTWYLDEVEK